MVNITEKPGTSVDFNETRYATPMHIINHENMFDVTISALLETRGAEKADRK